MGIMVADLLYTTSEVADVKGVNPRTVIGWIESGQLRARKVGRDWLVQETDMEVFMPPLRERPVKTKELKAAKQ